MATAMFSVRVPSAPQGRKSAGQRCVYCGKNHGDGAPFWNAGKDGWSIAYKVVTPDGKKASRSRLVAKGWEGHAAAMLAWKQDRFSTAPVQVPLVASIRVTSGEDLSVEQVCDLYLDCLQQEEKHETYKSVKWVLVDLCKAMGDVTVAELRQNGIERVEAWAKSHKNWGNASLEAAYKKVKTAFYKVCGGKKGRLKLIDSNPLAELNTGDDKVEGAPREALFSVEQVAAIFAANSGRGDEFDLAFRFLLETGCRPEEFCTITAADSRTDEEGQLYFLVKHKCIKKRKWKGKRRPVRILTKEFEAVCKEQLAKYPKGTLFRNSWNTAWTVDSLYQAFRTRTATPACKALGLDNYEVSGGKKLYEYVPYTSRHTFGHRCLTGYFKNDKREPIYLNAGQVADLMGNSQEEVEKTYGKISKGAPRLVSWLRG